MLCSKCGEKNRRKESFCVSCGTVLKYPCSNGGGETQSGLAENLASAISYVSWIPALFFFLTEQKNKVVRFHAMQSLLTFVPISILIFILNLIKSSIWRSVAHRWDLWMTGTPGSIVFMNILLWIVWLGAAALLVFMFMKAYNGEQYKLPIVGNIAAKQLD